MASGATADSRRHAAASAMSATRAGLVTRGRPPRRARLFPAPVLELRLRGLAPRARRVRQRRLRLPDHDLQLVRLALRDADRRLRPALRGALHVAALHLA